MGVIDEARERGYQLAVKLDGDPDTAFFGAFRDDRAVPVVEYPADEPDEA
jgi:hypothetical protein